MSYRRRATAFLGSWLSTRPVLRYWVRRSIDLAGRISTPRLAASLSKRVQQMRADGAAATSIGAIAPPHPVRMRVMHLASAPGADERRMAVTGRDPGVRPIVVCLSHLSPYPPRAGNEYRTHRLLTWMNQRGWDVVLLYCPLSGEDPGEGQVLMLAKHYPNLIYVQHGGDIRYRFELPHAAAAVASLQRKVTGDLAAALGEGPASRTARVIPLLRTFCPDAVIEAMLALDDALAPRMVLASYVFMSRGLPLLRSSALKVIDTHDVFSTKAAKVLPFGINDSLAMSASEEADLLSRGDLVLAIQPDEANELRTIAPGTKVVTVGVDVAMCLAPGASADVPIALLVGSGNALNVKGLRDFLRFAWTRVRHAVPDAELHVVGSIGSTLRNDVPGVRRLNFVDDLSSAYAAARVVINPVVAGTGLKIKTLEALAHLRPIVVWPSGLDGIPMEIRALCEAVTDWYAFSEALIRLLREDERQRLITAARDQIASYLAPERVYRELERELEGISRKGRGELAAAAVGTAIKL